MLGSFLAPISLLWHSWCCAKIHWHCLSFPIHWGHRSISSGSTCAPVAAKAVENIDVRLPCSVCAPHARQSWQRHFCNVSIIYLYPGSQNHQGALHCRQGCFPALRAALGVTIFLQAFTSTSPASTAAPRASCPLSGQPRGLPNFTQISIGDIPGISSRSNDRVVSLL
jgi:hypothetical protein